VAFPHSNCRAEIGVKTGKRLITDNTGPHEELDTNKFHRAILQHGNHNAPDHNNNNNNTLIYIAPACRMTSEALIRTQKLSPAMILF